MDESGTNGRTEVDKVSPPSTEKSCCCSCFRNTKGIPASYKDEIVQIFKLAAPGFMSQLMTLLIGFTSLVFCGHLGKTELSGVSLAAAVINVTGISVGVGLSSACDTLISQTYGSGNLKRVGVILQRAILILLLSCFPCWALLINTELLMLAARQRPEVARAAQLYVKIFMPALPATFMYHLQARYLQNQGIIWPQVISGVFANISNAIINYVFLYVLDLGLVGSAAANAISQYNMSVILFIYICLKKLHRATWDGWSVDCLREWGPFMNVALPCMLMHCAEWWLYEIGSFLAGVISEVELDAQSIIYEVASVVYMIACGFSIAASVRVGNALGAGNIEQAKLSVKVSLTCGFVVACFIGACLGISKDVIGYIFTSEKEIIERVSDVMKIYWLVHIAEALYGVMLGIIRGAGKQKVGALCTIVFYYLIGFPIGMALMFPLKIGIFGLWSGFLISASLEVMFLTVYFWKLDWQKAMEEALKRAGVEESALVVMEKKDQDSTITQSAEGKLELSEASRQSSDEAAPSIKLLLLRRGLIVLLMIIILAAGVTISELLIRKLQLSN